MITNTDPSRLLRQARSGCRTSLGQLAVLVRDRLYPVVYHSTRDHHHTEDVLQETLLALIEQINLLRRRDRFWPWIHQIAANKTRQMFRRELRNSRAAQTVLLTPYERPTVLERQIHAETCLQLDAAMQQIHPGYRDILCLRFYEQLPYDEMARRMHSSAEQLRVRFCRAKRSLRARMRA